VILSQYEREKALLRNRERLDKAVEHLIEFCNVFASRPYDLLPGVIVIYTWIPKKGVVVEIDGEVCGFIKSDDLGQALFNVYFGHKAVNTKVSSMCRTQWARKGENPDATPHQDEIPYNVKWDPSTVPEDDQCVMRGFQWAEYTFKKYPETGKLGHQRPFGESRGY